jgi:hypothetical protein
MNDNGKRGYDFEWMDDNESMVSQFWPMIRTRGW